MSPVTRLVTSVEVDDAASATVTVSARHEAELVDGRRVLLLDDRGWSSSGVWGTTTAAGMRETARVVVGPDEPFGDHSAEDMATGHWAFLGGVLRDRGVEIDPVQLRRLPHDVVLGPRVRALLGAG